jgi:hypothetical protein
MCVYLGKWMDNVKVRKKKEFTARRIGTACLEL